MTPENAASVLAVCPQSTAAHAPIMWRSVRFGERPGTNHPKKSNRKIPHPPKVSALESRDGKAEMAHVVTVCWED